MTFSAKVFIALGLLLSFITLGAADPVDKNGDQGMISVVVLSALDKITTQLSTIKIRQNQTVRFGTLEITLRYCHANPPEDAPENAAFLEITDVGHNNQNKKVFTGWMFSSSPALSPLEHPVYDVWVKKCEMVPAGDSVSRQ